MTYELNRIENLDCGRENGLQGETSLVPVQEQEQQEQEQQEQERVEVLNSVIRYIIDEIVEEVRYEIRIEQNRKPRLWERKWITRRDELGASQALFNELAEEDKKEYFFALRMSEESFEYLLSKVEPVIRKKDTAMRCALSPHLKLHIVLYFLATGISYRCLSHFFRVSKSSISQMLPHVCEAIYEALKDFIKASNNPKLLMYHHLLPMKIHLQCNLYLTN